MTKLYYRSIYDELNDMRTYLDSLFQQMEGMHRIALLPSAGEEPKMLPLMQADLRVDVIEHEEEIVVTVDIIEDLPKKDISIDLINPQLLEISGKRKEEMKEERYGYYMTESRIESKTRIIPIPHPVTEEGSMAIFRNGILEIHLRKEIRRPSAKIIIE